MASNSIGSLVLNDLNDQLQTVVEAVYGALVGSWPGQTFVALYVVIVGYCVLMGKAGDRAKEWGISALLLLTLSGVVSTFGMFQEWVISPILSAAQAGAGVAAGSASGGALSDILDAGAESVGKILAVIDQVEVPGNFITAAWLYIKVGIVVGVMGLLACAQYLAMTALLCIALFSLYMMFMVGGITVWLAAFKETRFITWTWLKQTLNYALWIFFLGCVAGVGNSYIGKVANILLDWNLEEDGVFTKEIGMCMLLSGLTLYMLLKAADWAAAITGGTSTNTGIVGAAGAAAGGALGGAANALGGAAYGPMKNAAGSAAKGAAGLAVRAFSALRGIGK